MRRLAIAAAVLVTAARPAAAQTDIATTPPPNVVLSNYNGVPAGPFGGLEGIAFVARTTDPSAAWFNPAGIAVEQTAQISGSAGVYQFTSVTPSAVQNAAGSSLQQLPNYVGVSFKAGPRLTAGFAALTTTSWSQETDFENLPARTSGDERIAYVTSSDFSSRIFAFSAGYTNGGPWRYGGGFAFAFTDLSLDQTASDRVSDAAGLRSLLISARTSGSAVQLLAMGGVRYDRGPLRVGAVVRTPAATIFRSGGAAFDSVLDLGAPAFGASLFDSDAQFEYHFPWAVQAGVAYVRDRAQVEFDLQGFSSIDPFAMIATGQPVRLYGSPAPGTPASVTTRPFQGLTSASDGVVNVAVGGHVRLSQKGPFRVHGGVGTDRSPAAEADTIFNAVNLTSWTVGMSGDVGKFQFAVGFNHRSGSGTDIIVRNIIDRQPVHTPVDVRTGGFIYSIAYQF